MIEHLDREDVLTCWTRTLSSQPGIRDSGLLDAAIARPQATVFGRPAYPSLTLKAAALLHSLARNHALLDGNKRTAWAATWLFLGYNAIRLPDFDTDAAEQFINDIATGAYDDQLDAIAEALHAFAETGTTTANCAEATNPTLS